MEVKFVQKRNKGKKKGSKPTNDRQEERKGICKIFFIVVL
jgi:hypothetical protein